MYKALHERYTAKAKAKAKPKPVANVKANSELANLFEEMSGYFINKGGSGVFKVWISTFLVAELKRSRYSGSCHEESGD